MPPPLMPTGEPMTIRQLAAQLGLSKSAVAYALRGSPEVSEETRDRVQLLARELGYVPNPVASAFLQQVRSQGTRRYQANLAFLQAGRNGERRMHTSGPPSEARFLQDLMAGAQDRAQELGYGLDEVYVGGIGARTLTRMLLARGVLGVAVAPLALALGHLTLDWSKFAAATFGYSMARPLVHRLVHDHAEGLRTALRICRRKGFTRIGLALSLDSDMRSNRQWSAAYLGAQLTLTPRRRLAPLLIPFSQFTTGAICHWVAETRPDVILVHATGCNLELPGELAKLSRPIPLVALDHEKSDACAGIDQQFRLSGRLLMDTLSSQILHNQRGIPETPILSMVKGLWVDHESLAPKKKSARKSARPG